MSAWSPPHVKDRDRLERVQLMFTILLPEAGEVEVAVSGREEKSLGFGGIIRDFRRIVCHSMEFVLPC